MTALDIQLPIDLEELRIILKRHGVVSASVFGSYARGDAKPDSDLDLLVTLEKSRTLFDLGGLQYELDQRLEHGADVTTKIHPRFESSIMPDLVEVL
jgi:predicted nucleotidyltransferase